MNNLRRSLSEAERAIAAWIAARDPDVVSPPAVWPICDRPRNDCWGMGRVGLVGDACYAVRPFMAAGGSMAIEDAAVLSRTITEFADPLTAFASYAAIRIPRVADVQRISIDNTWMHGPTETDRFFGYAPYLTAPHAA
jgi:6-hydroxynicotinate 3-monooxygenase